jgi:hypothetical protein
MNRYFKLGGILLVLISLLAVGFTQVVADRQRPFKANGPEWVVQEEPGGVCGADRIEVQVAGSGQGTHVGWYTITRQHCFNPAEGTFDDGSFELTAANGHKISGTYSGFVAGVVEFDDDGNPVVIIINATQVITGGSGRFANAQGQSELNSEFNLITQQGDFTMEGWISY